MRALRRGVSLRLGELLPAFSTGFEPPCALSQKLDAWLIRDSRGFFQVAADLSHYLSNFVPLSGGVRISLSAQQVRKPIHGSEACQPSFPQKVGYLHGIEVRRRSQNDKSKILGGYTALQCTKAKSTPLFQNRVNQRWLPWLYFDCFKILPDLPTHR